jgi:hypothetical protein
VAKPLSRNAMTARQSAWAGLFEHALRKCENPACKQTGVLRSFRLRDAEGIRFRGRWYCGPDCVEHATLEEFIRQSSLPDTRTRTHRIPIGLLMLSRGIINDAQLKLALALQKQTGKGRIGEFLQGMNAVTDRDIAAGLAAQWGCPVYPLENDQHFLHCAPLLPIELLETGRMLPVHRTPFVDTLHLAFVEGIDRTSLYAVEQMLRLKTIPCIISESALARALERLHCISSEPATVFESPLEPREMARTTRSYASQVSAQEISVARAGSYLWIRLQTPQYPKDILFQIVAGTPLAARPGNFS